MESSAQSELQQLKADCLAYSAKKTTKTWEVLKFDDHPQKFDLARYQWLKQLCQVTAREQRTALIVDNYLKMILCRSDADVVRADRQKLFDCIHMKFIIVKDLAVACNISVQDLLKYASPKVYSNITYFLLLDEFVYFLIEKSLCGFEFYKTHILPRSWFHLLLDHHAQQSSILLTNDALKVLFSYKNDQGKSILSLSYVKNNLYILISKIASTNQLKDLSQKHSVFKMIKQVFGFESEQELLNLYHGTIGNQKSTWFESMCLVTLIETLGLPRHFFLEQAMVKGRQTEVMKCFDVNLWWETHFFKQSDETADRLRKKVTQGLEFLAKHIKKDSSIKTSDFCVCFLEAFNLMFPKQFDLTHSAAYRQNVLFSFSKIVDLLFDEKLYSDFKCTEILEEALIQKSLYVFRLAQHEDTVEMSLFALQLLLNKIKIQKTLKIFPQMFALITHAYLNFGHRQRILRYTNKIFAYYIVGDKKPETFKSWSSIQFIMLKAVENNDLLHKIVHNIAAEVYRDEQQIETSFTILLRQISTSCEDIRILAATYILEILEQKEQDKIRTVLVRPEMLKSVYQCIVDLKQSDRSDQSIEFGIICARVLSIIGLCLPFVLDPVLLKANNQQSFKQQTDEESKEEKIAALQSERLNPLTNMKYNIQTVDNTLELLAMPSLRKLPLEREDPVLFAKKLTEVISELTQLNEQKPKNYYFAQFLLQKFIRAEGVEEQKVHLRGDQLMHNPLDLMQQESEHNKSKETSRADFLAKAVNRFSGIALNRETPIKLVQFSIEPKLNQLALYLISKIEDPKWQQVFEACTPLLSKSLDFLTLVLPYLLLSTIRHQVQEDDCLTDELHRYLNQILESQQNSCMELALNLLEFIKIAITQDKQIFKQFLEHNSQYKYNDKLYYLSLNQERAETNTQKFITLLNQHSSIKKSFLSVKKLERLLANIDKKNRNQASRQVANLKRCLYNMEDTFRPLLQQKPNSSCMDVMSSEDLIEMVRIQKQLMPCEFDSPFFNSIIRKDVKTSKLSYNANCKGLDKVESLRKQLDALFSQDQVIKDWKAGAWIQVQHWMADFDINEICINGRKLPFLIQLEVEDKRHQFELILGLLLGEYSKAAQQMLRSNDFDQRDTSFQLYMTSLIKVKKLLKFLYFELIFTLQAQQGEMSVFYKLFLHVLCEIETAATFLKDMFIAESHQVSELLKREVNKDKRKYEKIYLQFNLDQHFEKLLGWFEERSNSIQASHEHLKLIYTVRMVIFKMFDRENEYAFYLMKLAKLHRKQNQDVITVNEFFQACQKLEHKIVDFEYEYAKYLSRVRNAHEAQQYLHSKLQIIKDKQDQMQKQIGSMFMPKLIYEKAQLFEFELLMRVEPRNEKILENFTKFVKSIEEVAWEKPCFKFAQYIDQLERNIPKFSDLSRTEEQKKHESERHKRQVQRIYYYMKSIQHGHKYIWQSLPRALELWFGLKTDSDIKITTFMRNEFKKLQQFKVATVLQLLLSRFGHERAEVRETIVEVLSQLAISYPEHCAWWLFHFHFFEEDKTARPEVGRQQHAITRKKFSELLFSKISNLNKQVATQIMNLETLIGDLKKLCEKEIKGDARQTEMEMPKTLAGIAATTALVVPIEENLTPQMPPSKYLTDTVLRALVITQMPIEEFNPENLKVPNAQIKNQQVVYPAYKPNPIKIQGFLPKIQIMSSKEKPKKISVLGTDGKVYNFLLKCDKLSDLRKEQRFIDFAVLCNKMLQQNSDARQRGLRLRTYSIVPLSRHAGMIEWIQNTSTLKVIVNDEWKRNSIKGEMNDIKKMCQDKEDHTIIWPRIKNEIKPVFAQWFTEHFPSPDLWYEARVNFVKTCAIWSMIGYVIGLGDRHGDNILIHLHTGEASHVDFDCIFEKGATLKVPEIVPFRFTANIIDALGIFKEKGIFQKCCEVVLKVLRNNEKNIISYLESFKHDPLVEQSNQRMKIDDMLEIVDRKLLGNLNIGNGPALTVEEQVEQVILNAINDDSLSKMYIGWMPWL